MTQAVDQTVFAVKGRSQVVNSDSARDIIQSCEVTINKKYSGPKPSAGLSRLEMRRR